jgi:signal transduction histidine kinase
MFIELALLISVILQCLAAAYAISLISRTKYNISWILVTAGFLIMAGRRLYEFVQLLDRNNNIGLVNSWMAVLVSILMFVGAIYIRRIFMIQERIDAMRKQNDSKILSAIIQTEEKSRHDFAKELHDGLGPLLSAVKMSVSAIDKSKTDASNLEIIENTERNIDEAITAVKEISNNLSPHVLKNFGLHKAVDIFAEHCKSDKPEIRFSSNIEEIRFDYNTEIILYRIICELVANTIKHASASTVDINLFHRNGELELIYTDDGIGFNVEETENFSQGMGLSNIRSRIRSLKGTIEIFSLPEEGFNLKIVVPS